MNVTPDIPVDHMGRLRTALFASAKQATFACGGRLRTKVLTDSTGDLTPSTSKQVHSQVTTTKPVTIRFGEPGSGLVLRLPTEGTDQALQSLLSSCEPATFGRGGQDVYDETYRRATKLDTTEFCTDFNPYEHGIVDIIAQLLLPPVRSDLSGIRAELYKLNAYSAPAYFKPHVDTPRSSDQIGSLVVCLPSAFEGGALAVRHNGDEVLFDWSSEVNGKPSIQWAAFYSDCEHEVLPVVQGNRITLTYNLYVSRGVGNLAGGQNISIDRTSLPLYKTLQSALWSRTFMPDGGILGIGLYHTYPMDDGKLLPQAFKGVDFAIYETVSKLKLRFNLIRNLDMDDMRESAGWDDRSDWDADYLEYHERQEQGRTRDGKKLEGIFLEGFGSPEETSNNQFEGDEFLKSLLEDDSAKKYYEGDITWLKSSSGSHLSHIYIAYGNEASLGLQYCSAAFLIKIPSVEQRLGVVVPDPVSPSKRRRVDMSSAATADPARFGA